MTPPAPEGATKEYTDGYARIWEKIYSEVPEINSYFVVVAPGLDRPNLVNFALSFVRLTDWSERDRKTQEITASIAPKMFAGMPGVQAYAVNPPSLGQSFRNQPLQFVVQGNSYEDLDRTVNGALTMFFRNFLGLNFQQNMHASFEIKAQMNFFLWWVSKIDRTANDSEDENYFPLEVFVH